MKLGKKPATKDPRDLKFSDYVKPRALPPVPLTFGHDDLIADDLWGMLGNDVAGDCVFAGAAHEVMLWKAEVRQHPVFSAKSVLSDYSAVTGYNPYDPNSDQGTNVRDALNYRRSTGVIDANGHRHKILAYVALKPGNVTQLWQALYLFGAVGIGFEVPDTVWDQWDRGQKWTVVDPNASIDGGHYCPVVARRNGIRFVTWGEETQMSKDFYQTYCDEACASSSEMIVNQHSPEGFDLATLKADLALL